MQIKREDFDKNGISLNESKVHLKESVWPIIIYICTLKSIEDHPSCRGQIRSPAFVKS